MTFEDNVIKWASDRNIFNGSTPFKQVEKLGEEFTELAVAIGMHDLEKIADGIGDMMVVLTILAAQYELSIERCKDFAWNDIKDRTGKTINGKFIKDAP
jgi:NTP pyrophosphatase (non-canonical NTP hydrolase)